MIVTSDPGILTDAERERYLRQILLFDEEGQNALKRAHICIVGTGGLGSPIAMYLAAAGIGTITIVDSDTVTMSNLNRQLLHWTDDIGREKISSAAEKLRCINPHCNIIARNERVTRENVARISLGADIIIDAVDNYETRQILNLYSVREGKPFIHGAVRGLSGQMLVVLPGTACLRCIVQDGISDSMVPVLGVTPGIVGCMQANEAIKLLTGGGSSAGNLVIWNGETGRTEVYAVQPNPDCPVCGRRDVDTHERY